MNVTIAWKTRWHRRFILSALVGLVFVAGLTIGSKSAHSEDAKHCHPIAYTQDDYQKDVKRYGQKVADFNDGFATAREECKF